ncbi:MAG TPA: hypothetical protein VJR87_03885 [Allosphingosinicella sp.]|nr:hypothetical protein [Allosphingosinicella sp.]
MLLLLGGILFAGAPARAAPDAACALHVWPANNTSAISGGWLSNLGVAGAIADHDRNRDQNLRDQLALIEALTPATQARLLAAADLPAHLGMAGAEVRFESAPIETRSIGRRKERRTTSHAPCYGEFFVSLNFYQRSALHGRTLTSHFVWKDFRGGKAQTRIRKGKADHPVPHFPPWGTADEGAARNELAEAFSANVRAFVGKVGKER